MGQPEAKKYLFVELAYDGDHGRIAGHGTGHVDAAAVIDIKQGLGVFVHLGKLDAAVGDNGINVIKLAGDHLFDEVIGLLITQGIDGFEGLISVMQFLDADGVGAATGLEQPGAGDTGQETANVVVVEDTDELRDGNAEATGPGTHGELITEVTSGGFIEAGQSKVFPQGSAEFNVEIIEGHDAVDLSGSHQVGDGVDDTLAVIEALESEDFIQSMTSPRFLELRFDSEQDGMASFRLCSFDEGVAFEIAGEAKDGGTGRHESFQTIKRIKRISSPFFMSGMTLASK